MSVVAVATVVLLDQLLAAGHPPVLVEGLLDEPAHLLTAALLLRAIAPRVPRPMLAGALAGSVLVDLDHVPLYLWPGAVDLGPGRPVTHSLATVLALLVVALLLPGRGRAVAAGAGLGVTAHLFRDLASEPGVPLCWPLTTSGVQIPYAAYLTVLLVAATVGVARAARTREHLSGAAGG